MEEEKEKEKSQEEPIAPEGAAAPSSAAEGAATSPEGESALAEFRKKLDEAQAASEVLRDQLLRKAAEFENYKRRTEAEYANIVRSANESLITALLPIVEDFLRSLNAAPPGDNPFTKGVELIYQKLMAVLEARGLKAFDAVGKPFNVDEHDALLQVPRADVPPGTVVEEIARGYRLNDRVIRHARVIVASAPAEGGPQDEPPAAPGSGEPAGN